MIFQNCEAGGLPPLERGVRLRREGRDVDAQVAGEARGQQASPKMFMVIIGVGLFYLDV